MAVKGTISSFLKNGTKTAWRAKPVWIGAVGGMNPPIRRTRINANGAYDTTSGSGVRVTNPAALNSRTHRRAPSIGAGMVGDNDLRA